MLEDEPLDIQIRVAVGESLLGRIRAAAGRPGRVGAWIRQAIRERLERPPQLDQTDKQRYRARDEEAIP
jgi:hypothetical protein